MLVKSSPGKVGRILVGEIEKAKLQVLVHQLMAKS